MSEIEVVITVFMFTFTGLMLIIVGELCGNKALNSGHDVEYEKPDEPQKTTDRTEYTFVRKRKTPKRNEETTNGRQESIYYTIRT